jgi:hypothetical protein
MKKLKVYGVNDFKDGEQVHVIVACSSQKELKRLTGLSSYYIQGWASVTGNAQEIAIATAKPGTRFYRSCKHYDGKYHEWLQT